MKLTEVNKMIFKMNLYPTIILFIVILAIIPLLINIVEMSLFEFIIFISIIILLLLLIIIAIKYRIIIIKKVFYNREEIVFPIAFIRYHNGIVKKTLVTEIRINIRDILYIKNEGIWTRIYLHNGNVYQISTKFIPDEFIFHVKKKHNNKYINKKLTRMDKINLFIENITLKIFV